MGRILDRVVGERPQVHPGKYWTPLDEQLIRVNRDHRHVAIKVLSAYASSEIEAGRLGERELLQKVTNASPLHQGFKHVTHLLHEFAFESFAGKHICFVTDVLSYSVASFQRELANARRGESRPADPQLALEFILLITKDILKGLEYLHDECKVIHSGMFYTFSAVAIGRSNYLTDLKPGNILLSPSDVDNVIIRELSEQPSTVYGFPKTVTPDQLPLYPVSSAPLFFTVATDHYDELHWVITDLGHGSLTQC